MTLKSVLTGAISGAVIAVSMPASAETQLNVITGGSQNMVEYVTDYLGPLFEEKYPGVKVRVTGTGPGDAGSQKILEKLEAQSAAGKEQWDIDVIVAAQKKTGEMKEKGLLSDFRGNIETGKLVTRETAENALGIHVGGYVMPMFHSQTAIAYNPALVPNPPESYDELREWVKKYPKQFGYNGIKNGMSGVAFVTGWMYTYAGDAKTLQSGPYDAAKKETWAQAYAELKAFNEDVTFTPGNAGTLDMLNRGEIVMGPVWVDMFYSWQGDGRIPPNLKLKLIAPGMPGQPYYYAVPTKAANKDLAEKFIELATSPAVQAEGIVNRFNWYPGIDADHVKASLDEKVWTKLFTDVTPLELAQKGKPFPIGPYFDDIKEGYEKQVAN